MDAVAGIQLGQRRVAKRVLDQRHLKSFGPRKGVDREADAVDRNRPVQYHKVGEARRQSKVDESRVIALPNINDAGNAIDVPLYKMAAEPISDAERAFEIHAASGGPFTSGRSIQCGRDGRDGKPSVAMFANGQTRPVDRDAFSVDETFVATIDDELATSSRLANTRNDPNAVDQSGEHETSWSA